MLGRKDFQDNPSAMQKIKQLRYSESELNNEVIIITALLQHISTIKGNCLLVFERMEMLSENFDYGLIERLIKHCPKTLRLSCHPIRLLTSITTLLNRYAPY